MEIKAAMLVYGEDPHLDAQYSNAERVQATRRGRRPVDPQEESIIRKHSI